MPTLEQQQQQLAGDVSNGYVELFILDCTPIGGTIYRFSPHTATSTGGNITWQGQEYIALPIFTDGFEYKGDGSQSKPRLSVSNVNKTLLQTVISLGDIVGAVLTRYKTFANFLDGAVNADPDAYFPPDKFVIEQKLSHDNVAITWQLSSVVDRMGILLPRRQITKDGDSRFGGGFPGVGLFRSVRM